MPLPRTPEFDCTRAFFRGGYDFVGSRCDRPRVGAFRTRILLRPVVRIGATRRRGGSMTAST